jgi:putative transcriptional regulator
VIKDIVFNKRGKIREGNVFLVLATVAFMIAAVTALPSTGLAGAGQALKVLPSHIPGIRKSSLQSRPEIKPARGKFLVASRQLLDPQFSETVVLLIEYNSAGAMGVIINRPSELKLSEVLPELEVLRQRPDIVYLGGPVAKNQLLLLIRTSSPPEDSYRVFKDIYVTSSQAVIQRILRDRKGEERFRAYAGYAGWAPGQLDHEILRGGWHVIRADAGTVFDRSASEIWPDLIQRSSAKWVRLVAP